jgi:hypothetical protein
MSPVRYELSFYIPEDDFLHSLCRENLKSYRICPLAAYVPAPASACLYETSDVVNYGT